MINIDEKEMLKYFSANIDANKFISSLKMFECKSVDSKKITTLENQIEKMKCCSNCYCSTTVVWKDNKNPCYDCITPISDGVYLANWKIK